MQKLLTGAVIIVVIDIAVILTIPREGLKALSPTFGRMRTPVIGET
jgi:hypothetical protein